MLAILDLAQQILVSVRLGKLEMQLRAQTIQVGAFQESDVGGLAQQIIHVGVRSEGNTGLVFPDISLDGGSLVLAGHRDAVVPVADEVSLSDLVKFDGRKAAAGGDQPGDPLPAPFHPLLPGEKSAGEILIAAHAAHDVIQRDVLQTEVAHVVQT